MRPMRRALFAIIVPTLLSACYVAPVRPMAAVVVRPARTACWHAGGWGPWGWHPGHWGACR
ncbi:hypothetical protein GALL_284790 [mine drainage metagenome]|jgi:hypothetical protein|uniref:Lipoprotein n=1 Tax=mine drainage metagenome TaxID=410659 RepID=A0A1J5R142_9ZZZZ